MAEPREPKVTIHHARGPSDARITPHWPQLVQWVHEASNPFADWYFGSGPLAEEIIAEWMERPSSELFIGRAVVAFDDAGRTPVGCLLGMEGAVLAECRSADFLAFCEELGRSEDADAVLAEVLPAARALFPPVAEDEYYISRVAIAPEVRGRGFGRALVSSVLAERRAGGHERFCLDVSAANAAAVRVYDALGFRVVGTSRDEVSGLAYHRMRAG
jgi:ribosomal protein S18 acetylase RimI-like enzyme